MFGPKHEVLVVFESSPAHCVEVSTNPCSQYLQHASATTQPIKCCCEKTI